MTHAYFCGRALCGSDDRLLSSNLDAVTCPACRRAITEAPDGRWCSWSWHPEAEPAMDPKQAVSGQWRRRAD